MIKANELRIGNWVEYCDEYIFSKPYLRQIDQVNESIAKKSTPIPLTPEILKAAGFSVHTNSNEFWTLYYLRTNWYIGQSHHTEESAGVENGKYYWGDNYKEITSLHQLQNLYFALTGVELTINLTKEKV